MLSFNEASMFAIFIWLFCELASAVGPCKRLYWEKGVPNVVPCPILGPIKWTVDGILVNMTVKEHKKIYGYVPYDRKLYVYNPKHGEKIACSPESESERNQCYLINLHSCTKRTCKNNGQCEIADPGTPIERVTCNCKHLSKGYRCEEKYESVAWVTILLWLAVILEVCFILFAIYRSENQRIYKGVINRRFVDILREPDESFE